MAKTISRSFLNEKSTETTPAILLPLGRMGMQKEPTASWWLMVPSLKSLKGLIQQAWPFCMGILYQFFSKYSYSGSNMEMTLSPSLKL